MSRNEKAGQEAGEQPEPPKEPATHELIGRVLTNKANEEVTEESARERELFRTDI